MISEFIVIDKYVTTRWHARTKKHYEDLGYTFTEFGDYLTVRISDLTTKSDQLVNIMCPSCRKIRSVHWADMYDRNDTKCLKCSRHDSLFVDLSNNVYGYLTVVGVDSKPPGRHFLWKCKCICGNEPIVAGHHLVSGKTKSCGCMSDLMNSESNSGEKHYNWKGGISHFPYCMKFDKSFKEQIRNKFGNRCFVCNISETENNKKMSVHHIDYNKNSICNGHSWAFVPLCKSCHTKTNHNRWYWFNFLLNYWMIYSDMNMENLGWDVRC